MFPAYSVKLETRVLILETRDSIEHNTPRGCSDCIVTERIQLGRIDIADYTFEITIASFSDLRTEHRLWQVRSNRHTERAAGVRQATSCGLKLL